MKGNLKNKKILLIILITTLILITNCSSDFSAQNTKKQNKTESEQKTQTSENLSTSERNIYNLFEILESKLENFSKEQQAYIGAFIVSSASMPVFILIILFNIKSLAVFNTMSAFSAGALVGDVFFHNLPEIFVANTQSNSNYGFFQKKETFLGFGLISLFVIEKLIKLLYSFSDKKHEHNKHKKEEEEIHGHSHGEGGTENVILSVVGDFLHNITDGLAIGSAYATNLKLGITLTLSIFFHEIPHEVGDFSFMLKQNISKVNALGTQVFAAIGAFIGVYLNFVIGSDYSLNILSFASGTFLYLSINTILGDIKEVNSLLDVISELVAFLLGFYILFVLV